jgi:bla regulator protein BlaR1
MDGSLARVGLSLLLRSALFVALVLGPALFLDRLRLRARIRHGLLLVALLLAALAPAWLAMSGTMVRRGIVAGPSSGLVTILGEGSEAAGPADRVSPGIRLSHGWARRSAWVAPFGLSIWGAGCLLGLLRIAHGVRQVRRLRRGARPACPSLGEDVLISDDVEAAVVVGAWRPVVLLAAPWARIPGLSREQILMHERAHAQRRDPLWGLLQRIVTSVYWFHPLVHRAARALNRSREEACDDVVIAGHDRFDYAQTLLALATSPGREVAIEAGGGMSIQSEQSGMIEGRVRRIVTPVACAHGARAVARIVAAGVALLLLSGRLALALARPGSAGAPGVLGILSSTFVAIPAGQGAIFQQASPRGQGAFVLYDRARGRTAVLNPELAQTRLTPASTFKIIVALLALQEGAVADERVTLRWDGEPHEMTGWNRDLDLAEAMRVSATWYFDRLLARLDHDRVAQALRRIGYGNADASGDPAAFWLDDTLQISAIEQADVMARLAAGRLGPDVRSHEIVHRITRIDQRSGATLYGKTGTALVGGPTGEVIIWLVGHVQWQGRSWAFATVARGPAADADVLRARRLEITRTLLVGQGAYPAD